MKLEVIFELVRKEDVILWIGSGFSISAGYPNGNQLSKLIYESLSPTEQDQISSTLGLADLTEEFVRMKRGSRHELITLLKRALNTPPVQYKAHETLSKIPHIKTIITTNYDQLFEAAYKSEIHPIISEVDIPYADKKTELFKIHGDINNPNSIIITRSDYNNFFRLNIQSNLIWSVIKAKISNNAVVFIGYDLEDGNVINLLRDITDVLGVNKKQMFLVAPNLKKHKVDSLLQMGIEYVDCKGEPFIEKLYQNIKDFITTDNEKGLVSIETMHQFFKKAGLAVDFRSVGNRFNIARVSSIQGNTNGKLKLELKNDYDFKTSFKRLMEGTDITNLKIDSSQLESFKLLVNDINIVTDNVNDYQLEFIPTPKFKGIVNVIFDDNSEYENIEYSTYVSPKGLCIRLMFKKMTYTFSANGGDLIDSENSITGNFKIELPDNFDNVNDAIIAHKFGLSLATGQGVTIFLPNIEKGIPLQKRNSTFFSKPFEDNIEFFERLKKIEKLYKIRFDKIGEFGEKEFDDAFKLVQFANGGYYEDDWDEEFVFDMFPNPDLEFIKMLQDGTPAIAEATQEEKIILYGKEINLGFVHVEPLEQEIRNLEDVLSGNTSKIKIRSKIKKVKLHYVQTRIKPVN